MHFASTGIHHSGDGDAPAAALQFPNGALHEAQVALHALGISAQLRAAMVGAFRKQQPSPDGIPLLMAYVVVRRDQAYCDPIPDPQVESAGAIATPAYRSETESIFEGHIFFVG